jgi:hypothetical protein
VEDPDPVRVTLFTNPAEIETFSDDGLAALVPPETRLTGTPGPGCRGFQPWVESLGGADVGMTRLRLVLRGNSSEEVLVERMRARVLERRDPAGGIPLKCPSAGAKDVRTVSIDLDSRDALGHYETLAGKKPLAFSLAKGETEIFDLRVSTQRCHCVWVLDIGILVGDEPRTLTIPDAGEPFETTAVPGRGAPMYSWDYSSRWTVQISDAGPIETVETASLRPLWR